MDRGSVIAQVRDSECFKAESAYLSRGGFEVANRPRLVKILEGDKVRVIFPTCVRVVGEGVAVALVCLYDQADRCAVYAHTVFAGSSVNASLRSLFVPESQAKPQPGIAGPKAILQFVAWKQAGWFKFLNDELELGTEEASSLWINNFWRALDRMYGGGNLIDPTSG